MLPVTYATVDEWIAREAIPFSIDSPAALKTAFDKLLAALGDSIDLLGFGEAIHGSEEILILRNRLFQHLVENHGYRSLAIESSFPRGRVTNDYINGGGPATYDALQDTGFSHGFGKLDANRELIEWMRAYNADPAHAVKLHFYGFDLPAVAAGPASPRQVLYFALDYLARVDAGTAGQYRTRMDPLLGEDSDWENPMAWRDPTKAPALLQRTDSLRLETENLISDLRIRCPDCISQTSDAAFQEGSHSAVVARHLLNFYNALGRSSSYADSLAVRDSLMAENLNHIVLRERPRGKVLVFAHNAHLQRGQAKIPIGPQICAWWPAGSHLADTLGSRYAVIGTGLGVSEANGIAKPEPGTLEDLLTATPGPIRVILTYKGKTVPKVESERVPTRTGSKRNPSFVPLTPQSLVDFDVLAVLDTSTYNRGGRPLQ